jgi:protein TonB
MLALGEEMRFFENGNRAIGFALLLSLALHAALLFVLPALRESQQKRSTAREPIFARLIEPKAESVAVPLSPQALPEPKKPVPANAQAAKPQPKARPAPEPAAPAQPAGAEPVLAKVEAIAPAQTVSVAPSPPAAPAPVVTAARTTVSPAAVVPDAETLKKYLYAIFAEAKRHKRYPRVALDNNWQGKVGIRMAIGANGAIADLSIRSSAGYRVLDDYALELIKQAKATAQIPPALRGREFVMDIPVIFSLLEPDA